MSTDDLSVDSIRTSTATRHTAAQGYADPRHAARLSRIVRGNAAAAATLTPFRTVDELPRDLTVESGGHHFGEAEQQVLRELAERGYQRGFDQGRGEGQAQGRAEAIDELAGRAGLALQALTAAAAQLVAHDAVTLADLDDHVVGFAMEVVGAILGRELATVTDPGHEAIARAIGLIPDRGAITVRLHPLDFETIGEVTTIAPGREISLVPDPGVQRGGCLMNVGACQVDTQLGAALDRVRDILALPPAPSDVITPNLSRPNPSRPNPSRPNPSGEGSGPVGRSEVGP